jgi:hypothetical protein
MPSERVQRQIDRLLDEAEHAISAEDWRTVEARCRATYHGAARGHVPRRVQLSDTLRDTSLTRHQIVGVKPSII